MADHTAFLFAWRHAVASELGPSATTRHVLLTLSLYMDEHGNGAWPTTATLATRTGLSKRVVVQRLKAAREAGWLKGEEWKGEGHGWKRWNYSAHLPDVVTQSDRDNGQRGYAGLPRADERGYPAAQRGYPNGTDAVTQRNPNTSRNTSKNTSTKRNSAKWNGNGNGKRKQTSEEVAAESRRKYPPKERDEATRARLEERRADA